MSLKHKILFTVVLNFFILSNRNVFAQASVLSVETVDNAVVLQIDGDGRINMVYLGNRLTNKEEYGQISNSYRLGNGYSGTYQSAYTPAGSLNLLEPAIGVSHADGNNSLDLRYVSHKVNRISDDVSLLSIQLKDPVYDFEVTLYYKSYYKENVIEQWSLIKHHEKGEVILQKFASANLSLNAKSYWLTHYHGDWAKEMQPEDTKLTHGIKTLDSKLGTRSNLFMPSVFMLSLDEPATEDEGKVLFGALEWSGNFRTDFEIDPQDNLRIITGMNNYASPYKLKAGENFETPAFVFTFSDKGKGEASRNFHNWARNHRLLNGDGERLTLLNNWESTYFDFNEEKIASLLKDTKKIGVESIPVG